MSGFTAQLPPKDEYVHRCVTSEHVDTADCSDHCRLLAMEQEMMKWRSAYRRERKKVIEVNFDRRLLTALAFDNVAKMREAGIPIGNEKLDLWLNDEFQFPRLICEIVATCEASDEDFAALCESMDLEPTQVNELFDRAHEKWECIKGKLVCAKEGHDYDEDRECARCGHEVCSG